MLKKRKEVLLWHSCAPCTFNDTDRSSDTSDNSKAGFPFTQHLLHQRRDKFLNLAAGLDSFESSLYGSVAVSHGT